MGRRISVFSCQLTGKRISDCAETMEAERVMTMRVRPYSPATVSVLASCALLPESEKAMMTVPGGAEAARIICSW
ncbi:hypothetical protein D3C72_1960550 [compost metagenome]